MHEELITRTYLRHFSVAKQPGYPDYVFNNALLERKFVGGRIGSSNPLRKQQIAARVDATTPYSIRKVTSVAPMIVTGQVFHPPTSITSNGLFVYGVLPDDFPELTVDDARLEEQCLRELRNRVRNSRQDMKLLVPVVELRDLRSTITGAADLSMQFLHEVIEMKKRPGMKSVKRWRKALSSAWLTYGFGIAPLISDAQKIAAQIADYNSSPKTVRYKVSRLRSNLQSTKVEGTTFCYQASLSRTYHCRKEVGYQAACAVGFQFSTANNYGAFAEADFSWRALPSAGWELFPFSWVADYFTNAGAFLEDAFFVPPASTAFLSLTRRTRLELQGTGTIVPNAEASLRSVGCSDGRTLMVDMSRAKLDSWPTPSLQIKSIDEMGLNSVTKLLNLISLIK